MPTPNSLDQLLDGDVELDDIQLEQMSQEDLLYLVKMLRGHVLQLSGLIGELSGQIKILDAFARPKTSRRYFYAPGKERIIQ